MKSTMKTLLKILAVFFTVTAFAQQGTSTKFSLDVTYDFDTGIPKTITVSGKTDKDKIWLGVSLYPNGATDLMKQGTHKQIELSTDKFSHFIDIGKTFYNGSFEIALWGTKVEQKDCTIENCFWCNKNGFHLDELLDYKTGYLFWK